MERERTHEELLQCSSFLLFTRHPSSSRGGGVHEALEKIIARGGLWLGGEYKEGIHSAKYKVSFLWHEHARIYTSNALRYISYSHVAITRHTDPPMLSIWNQHSASVPADQFANHSRRSWRVLSTQVSAPCDKAKLQPPTASPTDPSQSAHHWW